MTHKLPELPYAYDSLEPFIDAKTIEIHHSKHHQAYVDKLNAALENHPQWQEKTVEELLMDLNKVPQEIRIAVRNHGGGHFNHSFFWPILKKGEKLQGEIIQALSRDFGDFSKFKEQFIQSATGLFGSGWAWLVKDGGKLKIETTANQDSPISQGKIPILGVDLWEHAYYLKYQNRRPEYLEAFFNVINWQKVNENLKNS